MTNEQIPRFSAYVSGFNVCMRQMPKGTLVNATVLLSWLQRKHAELREKHTAETDDVKATNILNRMQQIKEIIAALGEETI